MSVQPIATPVPPNWTLDTIRAYMQNPGPPGAIPIPSQKHGICAADTLQIVLFYADEIRDFFWQATILGRPYLQTICHTQHRAVPTTPDEGNVILMCWLLITAARVAGLIRKHQAHTGTVQRLPSEPLGQHTPIGDTCGQLALLYNGVNVMDGRYGLTVEYQDAIYRALTAKYGAPFGFQMKLHHELLPTDNVVAMTIRLVADNDGLHRVSIVKINGVWHWCDNNIGFAIPITLPVTAIPTHYMSSTYGPGRDPNTPYAENDTLEFTNRPNDGDQNSTSKFKQEFPTFKSHRSADNVPWFERDFGERRYFVAAPGGGRAAIGTPVFNELHQTITSMIAGSIGAQHVARVPTGSNYLDDMMEGGKRRRRLTSRLSSLPKRKVPSSGRSRGYTRRQRASRSGRGGYRAKGTGRKV